jgi:hypothetical protein
MKKASLLLLTLAVSLPAAAREAGYMYGLDGEDVKEMIKEQPAPEAAATKPAAEEGASCVYLSPNELAISRSVYAEDYSVFSDGRARGFVRRDEDGYVYEVGGSVAARIPVAVTDDGRFRIATVKGCGGAIVGRIVERDADGASEYTFTDASERELARSVAVREATWSASGRRGSVKLQIQKTNWLYDSFSMTMSGIDPRLALVAAVMNSESVHRRGRR